MSENFDELIEKASERLAIQWWQDMVSKYGKDYSKSIAKCYANKILELSRGKEIYSEIN